MKIALVEPWHGRHFDIPYMPSYSLFKLAGIAPQQSVVIDGHHYGRHETLRLLEEGQFDLVGVTAQTPHRHAARQILGHACAYGACTAVGGYHATAQPDFFDRSYVDYIIRGEGESWWADLVAGKLIPRITPQETIPSLEEYPAGSWSNCMPNLSTYCHSPWRYGKPMAPIALSYGCPGDCIFCTTPFMHGRPRRRSPDHIRPELEQLHNLGVHDLWVISESFGVDAAWSHSVCRLLAEFETFLWVAFVGVNHATPALFHEMRAGGCLNVIIGFESADAEMLRRLNKPQNDPTQYDTIVAWARTAGLNVVPTVLDHPPYETPDHAHLTQEFLDRNRLQKSSIGSVWVIPGTELYTRCRNAGILTDDFWRGSAAFFPYVEGLEK